MVPEIHNESIKNPCKFDARKRDAKNMNRAPKWNPNGNQNRDEVYQKPCPKIDAKKGLYAQTCPEGRRVRRAPLV